MMSNTFEIMQDGLLLAGLKRTKCSPV